MLFNSPIFLLLFLPVTYVGFWLLRKRKSRYLWLVAASYVFYGYWNPWFCILMAVSTLDSYLAGLGFLRWGHNARARKWLLIAPLALDLGFLGYFKYANFTMGMLNWPLEWYGQMPLAPLDVILPVGISFYTFGTISYVVDCYRGKIEPTGDIFEFACFVSLFPQLVAGPIIRFAELKEDLENIESKDRRRYVDMAWSFFIIGLAQKVLLADTLAAIIDPALENVAALSTAGVWLCMLGYSYQLYFDFAGYSNMAVGLGLLFGMRIPQNFRSPYKALNPSDFWTRWHISLSRWLRDYLYIPLGGSRGGNLLTYRNLMITMLLGGLWHGAAWTFVAWGAYHGMLLVMYRKVSHVWDAMPEMLQRAWMFFLVVVGWTLFRSPDFATATALLTRMFVPHEGAAFTGVAVLLAALAVSAAIAHFGPNTFELRHQWKPQAALGWATILLICIFRIYSADDSPFLYFQF